MKKIKMEWGFVEWIHQGTIKKDRKTDVQFEVRKLTNDDVGAVLYVQERVIDQLVNKEVFQPLSEAEFRYILAGNGLMVGAYTAGELIAFRALLVPPLDDEHLGWEIGLSESELSKVIYQEISSVLPAYRGNQLQKVLAKVIMKELAKQPHSYRYLCSTVAPFNIPSLKDKFTQGMKIAALKEKYGGRLRYIFVKDLEDVEAREYRETIHIRMNDTVVQQEKLTQGWRGIRMEEKEGTHWVHYVR